MQKITVADVLQAAERKHIASPAKAAMVLQEVRRFLEKKKHMKDFWWEARTWENGVVTIVVEHSAAAQIVYGYTEECKQYLQKVFPTYTVSSVRVYIEQR